jgi:RNA polymerase sigma-70 factor (ECF subfamily)
LNDQSDENVVRACRGADKTAYGLLVKTHYRRVFALCFGMLGNVHDAEDVAQETLLKGLRSLRKLAKPERFEPWVLRIAKNQCIDLLRRRKHVRAWPVEHEPVSQPPAQEHDDLEAAIRRLPQELRLPLVLFYFEHKDAGSIAGTLGISPSLVYERLRAARESLHKLLAERGTHE